MHTYLQVFIFLYIDVVQCFSVCVCVCVCVCLSLSLSLLLALVYSMTPKRKSPPSQNPLHSGVSTSSSDPTPSHVQFRDNKARKDFSENFSQRGIHLECQVILSNFSNTDLPTVIYSRGWGSLCDIPVTCPSVIIQELYSNIHRFDTSVPHSFSHIRGTRIVVTPDIVSKVLHVPRVAHPDYPSCDRLRTMSKDKLSYLFCETPSSQGDHQNTPCSGFAKGLRFLNMVMTFILHPLSHYNFITEPCARFFFFFYPSQRIFLSTSFLTSFYSLQMSIGIRRPVISSFFLRLLQ